MRLDRRFAALLVGFSLAFLIFFCHYNVMIVRNYLLIGPFDADARAAVDYIAAHPQRRFRVSPKVRALALRRVSPCRPT